MWQQIALGVGGLLASVMVLAVLFTLAMRMKFRPVLDAIRKMNRSVFNPRTMQTAGQPGAYASVVRHVGRTTGTPYETPVVTIPTDDGFVVALPYGTRADWLKNVQSAGHAVIVNEGHTYRVDRPEVRPAAVGNPYFSLREQRNQRLFGIGDVLLVRRADSEQAKAEIVT